MSLARVLDVCDAVAAFVGTTWDATATPRTGGDAVARAYAAAVGTNPDQPDTLVTGRKVYVFPGGYADVPADRGSTFRTYTVDVLVAERYEADAAGDVPRDWVDARVNFVEQVIFTPLRNPLLALAGAVVAAARPDQDRPAEVDAVYDFDHLTERKLFYSQARFYFFDAVDNTGG